MNKLPFGTSIVAASFAAQALALGLGIGIYPVFMAFIESDYGISRTQSSAGLPMMIIVGALASPLIGAWVDKGSPRKIMCIGAISMALGLSLLSQVEILFLAALIWALLVGVGQAMLGTLPATAVVSNWFLARRSTMVAIAATGITFGMALSPPLSQWLIDLFGWRSALLGLGLICAVLGVPLALLGIAKTPQERGLNVDGAAFSNFNAELEDQGAAVKEEAAVDKPVVSQGRFWLVAGSFCVMSGMALSFTTHVVGWAGETGFERREAVMLLSLAAVFAATGKLSFGYLCDRVGLKRSVWTGVAAQFGGWSIMLMADGPALFIPGAVCFAFGSGCIVPLQAASSSKLWGAANFGRVLGYISLVAIIGVFLAPTLLGAAYEKSGGYGLPMLFALPLLLIPALLFAGLKSEQCSPEPMAAPEPSSVT